VNETVITVVGNVATEPKLRVTSTGVRVVSFRLASTERRYDKALRGWRDGDTVFYTVTCWRNTGENALDSVVSGQPMVVRGKLRNPSYEKEGQKMSYLEIEAYSLGHDLSRGVSRFTRASQAAERPELVPDDADEIDEPDEPDGSAGRPAPVPAIATGGRRNEEEDLGSGSPSAA
jgi:single-strand DNA-binding protein